MPTWESEGRFKRDYDRLTPAEQARLKAAVRHFVSDLRSPGSRFRAGLRVKGVAGHPALFELTWAPNGRMTFHFGESVIAGEAHVVWRRCGGHEIFADP